MKNVSKRSKAWLGEIDSTKKYDILEAVELLKKFTLSSFAEKLDVCIRLGIDPRKTDQMIRSSCSLPNGTGKEVRILVIANGEKEKEALDAGADFAGGDSMIEKIQGGWLEFDRVIATPDAMGLVGKIGRILGPRGLMPNPKVGTVTMNIADTVTEIKKGQIQFRTDKSANVHASIGLVSFEPEKIKENLVALYDTLIKLKPASAKGSYIRGVNITSTMGPGIKIDENSLR